MNKLIGLGQLVELFIASENANKAYYACDITDIDVLCDELHNANNAFSVCFEHFKKVNNLNNEQACALLHSTVNEKAIFNQPKEKAMHTQLFFCEFKGYIATAFNIAQLDLTYNDLNCLFDLYEAYLNSNSSIYHFVNSNFSNINARINLI